LFYLLCQLKVDDFSWPFMPILYWPLTARRNWLKKVAFIHILVVWWAGQITGTLSVVVADPRIAEDKEFNLPGAAALNGDRAVALWN